jgi:hypothetical protein
MADQKKPFERLPKIVKPRHYDLFLSPNLQTFTFEGKTSINIEVIIKNFYILLSASNKHFDVKSLRCYNKHK